MTYGLQVMDSAGNITFDSTVATGGVCLGFYTVASGGSTFSFPDFVTETGLVFNSSANGGNVKFGYTTNNSPGYLQFIFDPICAGATVVLFAK